MTTILYKYGATIDKYIGDCVMAFWGAPIPQEDHAQRAVLAAFEMHQEIHKLTELFHSRGLPTPTIGIGINSGVMNVGNMGSHYRLAYTVIGDPVNLAFRLQSATREYSVDTIIGEESLSKLSDMTFRELDTIAVKGKTKLTRIFEPICLNTELDESISNKLTQHNIALAAYYAQNFVLAANLFKKLMQEYPGDDYYQHMINKCLPR
jgi:adenylate cyclase